MPRKFSDTALSRRIISAIVLVPLVLLSVWYGPFWLVCCLAGGLGVLCFWECIKFSNHLRFQSIFLFLSWTYIVISITSMMWMRYGYEEHFFTITLLLVAVWFGDIGAYFSGKTIGGPKLMPLISPNKTWAGFFGGALATLGAVLWMTLLFDRPMEFMMLLTTAILIICAGQMGDLLESAIKRRAGLKDSGNFIPGHGGILDRVDSLLMAAPIYALYLWLQL